MSWKIIWKMVIVLGALLGVLIYCVQNDTKLFFVATGSMNPVIPSGSLVVSRGVDINGINVGEVVVFNDQGSARVTTHRVVKVRDGRYITRGDVNVYQDKYAVKPEDVLGQVIVVLPIVGFTNVILQLAFLALTFTLGVLMRRFLLFLIKYGFFCPAATCRAFFKLCVFGRP